MKVLEAYETFVAMGLHWTTEAYDFIQYNGKIKGISRFAFDKRKDKERFFELANYFPQKKDLVYYLVPLYLYHDNVNIHSVFESKNKQIADDWYRKIQNTRRNFEVDVQCILNEIKSSSMSFEQFFIGEQIKDFLVYGHINIESFIILEKILKFLDKSKGNVIMYETMYEMRVRKYSSFIQINLDKYKDILSKQIKKQKEAL